MGHTLVALGKGREVLELCHRGPGVLVFCLHVCSHVSCIVLMFWRKKAHGMPFEGILLSPSHVGGEQKRKSCGTTSEEKVPTCGFSAKQAVVWRNLSAIFHHLAKKEGGWCNLSSEKCQLADFQQKRKLCGATSRNSYFFVYQYRLNAP